MTSTDAKADMIRFWCIRAAEGRDRSLARSKVGWGAIARAAIQWLVYSLGRPGKVDYFVVAHNDRGAPALADIPYVGTLSAGAHERGRRILLFQMEPLARTPGVVSYPWLFARAIERLRSRTIDSLAPDEQQLAESLADRYRLPRKLVKQRLLRLEFELAMWRRLLSRHCPSAVLLVDGYSANTALISEARRQGVRTIEAQHGSCVRGHVGYRSIGASEAALYPDLFLAWNKFWKTEIENVPGYRARAKVCPLTSQRVSLADIAATSAPVLVVHQPTVSNLVYELISSLPDAEAGGTRLTVKYHPGIQPEWKQRLDTLCAGKGVAVISSGPLDEALARHSAVVGWFSTVLYQAKDAGLPVYYLAAKGYEEQQRPLAAQGIKPIEMPGLLELAKP